MFPYGNTLAHAPFGPVDVPAGGHFNTGTFWHGDFSAQEIFALGIFGTIDISEYLGT